jgi:hypothetical protein
MCNECKPPFDPEVAHKAAFENKESIRKSRLCGCFYCAKIYVATDVIEFIHEPTGGETAFCPVCGIDSLIGDATGIPITLEYLKLMQKKYFGEE